MGPAPTNHESPTKYAVFGPNNVAVASAVLRTAVPYELVNSTLPSNGRYVLVVEPINSDDLTTGIDIGFSVQLDESTRVEPLELNMVADVRPGRGG